MKQFLLLPLQSDNAFSFRSKQNNANTVNINTNTKYLTQKSKDFTIFISEIHQNIAEIRGYIRISLWNIANF